jgi:beta-lactam-binding protein with PASTA domain
MANCRPPVEPDALADQMGDLPTATDRVRLVGLDHAARVQQARVGATNRRLVLTRARRADDIAEIGRLQTAVLTETRAQRSYGIAVQTAEVEVPARAAGTFVLHGRVFGETGAPADKLTVAAVDAGGQVRRFTCTDAKGYFRMDLPLTATDDAAGTTETVFLQVSDTDQAVRYRGDEAIALGSGGVAYREIRLSGERLPPCPPPPDRALMPDVLDRPESVAIALLGRLGLKVARRLTQQAAERVGLVISQSPAAGTPVTADTAVTLVIGTAEDGDTVVVPEVVGSSRDQAQAKLGEAGLTVGQVSEQPGAPAGTVLKQSPEAGVRVPPGTAVALVVAVRRPEERVEVPALVGRPQQAAETIVRDAGLTVGTVRFRDDPRAGTVLDQQPPAGTLVVKETSIDLVVGRRSDVERTDLPNLIGRSLAGAKEILEAARLQLGAIEGPENGRIVEQKPPPGTAVPVGSVVSVTLSGAVRPAPDGGDFTGRLADRVAADAGFQELGLTPQTLRERFVAAGITDAAAATRLVEMSDADLQETFGLRNRNHARSFRRMLRSSLEAL